MSTSAFGEEKTILKVEKKLFLGQYEREVSAPENLIVLPFA
jgi:hypothetical protein